MGDRGHEIHLQLGEFERAQHLGPLNRPDGYAGKQQCKAKNANQAAGRTARRQVSDRESLRGLFVEAFHILQILANAIEGRHAAGEIEIDRFFNASFQNRSQHLVADFRSADQSRSRRWPTSTSRGMRACAR